MIDSEKFKTHITRRLEQAFPGGSAGLLAEALALSLEGARDEWLQIPEEVFRLLHILEQSLPTRLEPLTDGLGGKHWPEGEDAQVVWKRLRTLLNGKVT